MNNVLGVYWVSGQWWCGQRSPHTSFHVRFAASLKQLMHKPFRCATPFVLRNPPQFGVLHVGAGTPSSSGKPALTQHFLHSWLVFAGGRDDIGFHTHVLQTLLPLMKKCRAEASAASPRSRMEVFAARCSAASAGSYDAAMVGEMMQKVRN